MPCLTPTGKDTLRTLLTTDGSKLSQLVKMDTQDRTAILAKSFDDATAKYINYNIEKRMVSKTTKVLTNWAKKEVGNSQTRSDILKRVNKFSESIGNNEKMQLLLNNNSRQNMLESLIAQKIGVAVSLEESGVVMDLANKAETARKELTNVASATTNYGKAFNDIAKGMSEKEALANNNITKEEYKKITEQRNEAGKDIYEYVDYMDQLKQETTQLKMSDFTANWFEASKKLGSQIFDVIPRFMMASGDLGFMARQGLRSAYYDPKTWHKNNMQALKNAKDALAKNLNFKALVMADIFTRPNMLSGYYTEAKLGVHTLEDYFQNSLIEPLLEPKKGQKANILQEVGQRYVKYSQDTYLAYMYKLRADLFDAHFESLDKAGVSFKQIGEFFNNLTGRGEGALAKGGSLMFAPRYVQSQLNNLVGIFNPNVNKKLRQEYAKNLAVMVGATASILAIAQAMGAEIEKDPRSTKFGRIQLPNGYILDISGGLGSYVNLMSRLATGKIVTSKGKERNLGDFGVPKGTDLIWQFLVNKGSPMASSIVALLNQELFGGEELTALKLLERNLMPIVGQDIKEVMSDEDIEMFDKVMLSLLSLFGVNNYNPETYKKTRRSK